MTYCKTLKELANLLGVTYYRIRKIRDQIEARYPSTPKYMIWGSKGYQVDIFADFVYGRDTSYLKS